MLAEWVPRIFQPDAKFAARSRVETALSRETVVPLARRVRRPINVSFDDKLPGDLARFLTGGPRFRGKNILIAWRHDTLPAFFPRSRRPTSAEELARNGYNWIGKLRVPPPTRSSSGVLKQPLPKESLGPRGADASDERSPSGWRPPRATIPGGPRCGPRDPAGRSRTLLR
jgi:hypothetical protein